MRLFGNLKTFLAARSGVATMMMAALAVPSLAVSQDIVLAGSSSGTRYGRWAVVTDTGASIGSAIRNADAGAAKITTALASPYDYFELSFDASAGKPYRLWIRGRAQNDYWGNDSVFVQFSNSVNSSGSAIYRIGTTSAAEVNLEECSGCGLSGWKWQDNGWGSGVLGPVIYFASSGTQRLRVQTREDGLTIDQIVLSPSTYLNQAPSSIIGSSTTTGSTSGTTSTGATSATNVILAGASAPTRYGGWTVVSDSSAAGGAAIRHPNAGAAKITTALASPTHYFELTFNAVAGAPYRLWIHGRADYDDWANDSVFVQFSNSVNSSGSAVYRIGTTSAASVNLEDCSGCGLSGWKWQDNGWGGPGVLGPTIYFASTGQVRMRVQTREDGLSIDQIILSPTTYLSTAPPATSSTAPTATVAPAPAPAPAPTTTTAPTGSTLKVMTWNTQHGTNLDSIAQWIASSGANVVGLNEVEKYNYSWGYTDQPARYVARLQSLTGKTWYSHFAQRDGGSTGQGNLILSTFPFEDKQSYVLSYSRSVSRAQILVNGIRVNLFGTHLDSDYADRRAQQMKELKYWASNFSQQWISMGDFNAWPGAWEIATMTSSFYDAWARAVSMGIAVAYAGNEAGNTRNSRIDYVFYSHSASRLYLKETRVLNTGTVSDHRPVIATFEVR
jgi:endonuclease/exonuclease/phosphatase family metal-dependent hydrolase